MNNYKVNTYEAVMLYNLFANHNAKFAKELLGDNIDNFLKNLGVGRRFDLYNFKKYGYSNVINFYKVEFGKQVTFYDSIKMANDESIKYRYFYNDVANVLSRRIVYDSVDYSLQLTSHSSPFISQDAESELYSECQDFKCQVKITKELLDKCEASKLIVSELNKYGEAIFQNIEVCGTEFVAYTKYYDKENLKVDFLAWIANALDFVKPIYFMQDGFGDL